MKLPIRATIHSSGCDFYTREEIVINPQQSYLAWTDVKAYMQDEEWLLLIPRSSAANDLDISLKNTVGDVDSDYYNNAKNEGNIGINIRNNKPWVGVVYEDHDSNLTTVFKDLTKDNTITIPKDTRIAQGVFLPYLPPDNPSKNKIRTGGFGHSGK